MTFKDLCYRLANRLDEITLMELLEVTSEDLVQKFSDRIEDNYDYLVSELEEFEE
jgi:hypothetical protein